MLRREELRSPAVEHTQNGLKAYATVVWSIFLWYEATAIYFIVWCITFIFYSKHVRQQCTQKKKKQMCMLLKKVDDERTFCAKCLQAFIILYGSQSDLMSRTRKVKDTNLLKIHQHLLSNTMPEDNGLKQQVCLHFTPGSCVFHAHQR